MLVNGPTLFVQGLLEAACSANPYSIKYLSLQAQYELSRADPDRPIVKRAYQRALELDPRSVSTRLEYAEGMMKIGDEAAALDQFKEALRYDDALPKDEPKRLSRGERDKVQKQIARLSR